MTVAAQPKLFMLPFDEAKLGRNQRAVLARIDSYGWVSAREAGRIVYLQRGINPDVAPKAWLLSAGLDVLKSLQRRLLVKRRWRRNGKTSVWVRDPRRGRA